MTNKTEMVSVPRELLRENIEYLRGMGGTYDQKSALAAKFELILLDPTTEKDLRKQYEDWADENGYDITRNDHGDYAGIVEDSMWTGWQAHDEMRALLAAPAEDVRAVGEEPVACYVATDDLEAIQSGSKMWATAWATDSAMNPSRSFSQPLYRHPHRPVEPQCSEVAGQCSEVLRTQGRPVVLPERYDETHYRGGSLLAVRRWNACIDEFERLNKC